MDKTKTELKVGIFILIAIVILAIFIFKVGNIKDYGGGYLIKFIFKNVSGVKSGSPVRLSGVDVGEVDKVNILIDKKNKNTKVELTAWIKKSISIPRYSQAYINTLGLLGEKYIEIIPPDEIQSFLASGETIVGVDPAQMQDWISEAENTIKDFQELIAKLKAGEGTVGKLLNDDRLYQELEGLIGDLRRNPWKLFWKTKEKK